MSDDLKEIISRQSRTITVMFLIILFLLAAVLVLSQCKKSGNDEATVKEEQEWFCGNATQDNNNEAAARQISGISGDYSKGQKLFKQNCAVCHSMTGQSLTGPGLKGIYERVPAPQETWLKNYILNYKKVIRSGDAYAQKIHAENKHAEMTVFEGQLSEKELNDLLLYLIANTR